MRGEQQPLFYPGRRPRTSEQRAIRAAGQLLMHTRQAHLVLGQTVEPAERRAILMTALGQIEHGVRCETWPVNSPRVQAALRRLSVRLRSLSAFVSISHDSFHQLRFVTAGLLGTVGDSAEALQELDRFGVFLSVQSNELRMDIASRYFDLCVANGRFLDGVKALMLVLSRSRRRIVWRPSLHRQFALIIRRHSILSGSNMRLSASALALWSPLSLQLRPRRLRNRLNALFFSRVLAQLWCWDLGRLRGSTPPRAIRAMGGVGDLLAMTPGLRALAKQTGQKVQFAIPRKFSDLFDGNEDVEVIPLEQQGSGWLLDGPVADLTDCPAARGESAAVPDVRLGRIELFAAGMGIDQRSLLRSGCRPVFEASALDRTAATLWLAQRGLAAGGFIVVQAEPAEQYRRFAKMPDVAKALAATLPVVVLHDRFVEDYTAPNVHTAFDLSLGVALAVACAAACIVAANSALVHLAGAHGLPSVGIFGPTDGRIVTKFYPDTRVVALQSEFACMPCWRNEHTPCVVTGGMRSACLDKLPAERVTEAATKLLAPTTGRNTPATACACQPRSASAAIMAELADEKTRDG